MLKYMVIYVILRDLSYDNAIFWIGVISFAMNQSGFKQADPLMIS